MASIHKRNGKYAVMYNYVDENGKRRQKWESFKTQAEAMKRKKEVEYKKVAGTLTVPKCTTMSELLNEYVAMYGKTTASVHINKELQRVNRETLKLLGKKDVIFIFPSQSSLTTTQQVLKSPKTESSIRKVFLPRTVAEMLTETRRKQLEVIDALGDEYKDFNLVIAGPLGMPVEARRINGAFDKLIKKNNLPKVVFHSLRHSSITYKLKLNGGDIKAVQGDSGHAQSKMVTDLYSHILDDDRRQNAQLFEDAFYSGRNQQPQEPAPDAADAALLMKLLQNPEMAALIKTLAKTLQ